LALVTSAGVTVGAAVVVEVAVVLLAPDGETPPEGALVVVVAV
jgi:hypothetical protein